MYEYTTTMSYGIPCIISYILWTSQVITQSNTLKHKTYENFYPQDNQGTKSDYFRYMYCWFLAVIIIYFLVYVFY